jgi:hypothetical protein
MPFTEAATASRPIPSTTGPLTSLAPRYVAVLLAASLSLAFFGFRSNAFIGDGLRHLPALRTIVNGPPVSFEPKPWLEVYRAHYERVVVRNHFLYALIMRTAFALQRAVGIRGDAIIAMQAVNAMSAGIAAALFFLLLLRLGVPQGFSLVVTVGLCLSPFYLLAATNVAELAPALPFFLGALLVVSGPDIKPRQAMVAGLLAGMAAITYFLTGALVPCIAAAILFTRSPLRWRIRACCLFFAVFALIFLGIWVAVLFLSGAHTATDLVAAIVKSPQEGTYGGFKLGALVAAPVGLTEGFFPILPDDFRGLRALYHEMPWTVVVAAVVSLVVCGLLVGSIHLLRTRGMLKNPALLASVLALFLVEAVCLEFDPYYWKLQTLVLILFWTIVAVATASDKGERRLRWLLLLLVTAVAASGATALRTNIRPSQANQNAQQMHAIVGEGVVITGWSADVAQLWLYSNGENIISLPDFAFARALQPGRVEADLDAIIAKAAADGTKVYFYGLFDTDDANLTNTYVIRFRLTGFTSYVRGLQRNAQPLARFAQPGGHQTTLYLYNR